jgi:hypothetical protein
LLPPCRGSIKQKEKGCESLRGQSPGIVLVEVGRECVTDLVTDGEEAEREAPGKDAETKRRRRAMPLRAMVGLAGLAGQAQQFLGRAQRFVEQP